jgi:hypothetical protein
VPGALRDLRGSNAGRQPRRQAGVAQVVGPGGQRRVDLLGGERGVPSGPPGEVPPTGSPVLDGSGDGGVVTPMSSGSKVTGPSNDDLPSPPQPAGNPPPLLQPFSRHVPRRHIPRFVRPARHALCEDRTGWQRSQDHLFCGSPSKHGDEPRLRFRLLQPIQV